MALVSLGSALFTINSTFAFLKGPMSWDSSRVSAAIPSGVGFLGGGLIVKSSDVDPITGERHHLVQGITTAAATWLSAAVGIACGGVSGGAKDRAFDVAGRVSRRAMNLF